MLYLNRPQNSHSPDTQRALRAADGYLFLGLADEALAEIEGAPETEQELPEVLLARNRVLLHLGRWNEVEALAAEGIKTHPEREEFTVQRAFALHKLKKGEEALGVIESAPEWIRRTGILHYNLACYEAQLGDKRTARQCINVAIQMNEAMRKNAKADPDLRGLWN
jgi:tetratricopeptide (TPR) repeat protein